ncbi:AraC family transcriptional regulator [Pseudoalteromonas sp. T1lg65]|uniref:AraC family transcriptional regulator n=1 Tax=Pseudoalteromonas sp. T1lg65 TaxID=2077101 RepID=UPI003F795A6E
MNYTDPLSLLVSSFEPEVQIFSHLTLTEPWGISESEQNACFFSYVKEGQCVVEVSSSSKRVSLSSGQLLLLPSGSEHKLMSQQGVDCVDIDKALETGITSLGGKGEHCFMMCGSFVFDPLHNWGVSSLAIDLPEYIVIDAVRGSHLALVLDWIYRENEVKPIGSQLNIEHLLKLLLMEVIRDLSTKTHYFGWIPAIHDRFLAPAIIMIQKDYSRHWTLEKLAEHSALSKSAFSKRFKTQTGYSPISFLNQWRCLVAAKLLVLNKHSVQDIGINVGFQSGDVFIRNFRAFYHTTPKRYRLQHQRGSGAKSTIIG